MDHQDSCGGADVSGLLVASLDLNLSGFLTQKKLTSHDPFLHPWFSLMISLRDGVSLVVQPSDAKQLITGLCPKLSHVSILDRALLPLTMFLESPV